MKQIFLWASLILLAACNSNDDSKKELTVSSTANESEKITYPMPSEYSDTWEMGDPKNSVSILNLYKGWVEGNLESFKTILADSVELHWATGDVNTGPGDSVLPIILAYRNQFAEVKNTIHGFMSVRHRDLKQDFVMVWVKEITTTKDGKKDSVELQENWRLNNAGKIDAIYQYDAAIKPLK